MKRVTAVVEVVVALALFGALLVSLRGTAFAAWQSRTFGFAPASSALLFLGLPLVFLALGRKNPGCYGLAGHELAYHRRLGLRAAWVLLPVGVLFPVIRLLGSNHEEWLGATILTAGVAVAGWLVVRRTSRAENREPRAISAAVVASYLAVVVVASLVCMVVNPLSRSLAGVVQKLVFVGFLEEFFFRGYLQSRLNDAFGRPLEIAGVAFGSGLIIGAVVFGVMHPLSSPETLPWPWALWTGAGGLVFGFLREKSGSALAPAIAHGLWVLPTAFLSP